MKLNYCIECAAPLTKRDNHHYFCTNDHIYYNNPKATTDVVLLNDANEILVSKRAREPDMGKYDLPGGFIEHGESAEGAAVREIKEETGLSVAEDDLEIIFTCCGPYFENEWCITTIFMVRAWTGTPIADDDSAALEWKPLSFMDSPDFAEYYRGLREVVEQKLGII